MSGRTREKEDGKPSRKLASCRDLHYVEDKSRGLKRRPCGRGFTYLKPDGDTLRDDEVRERIEELAIPPGWDEVWICSRPDGHLQATGRDSEGRKQYIYHPRWRRERERDKYGHLAEVGSRLPVLRQRVGRDVGLEGLPLSRVAAAATRLLDRTSMRIGNDEYADENGSFGIATLQNRHVTLRDERIRLSFSGKSGQEREIELRDEKLARAFRELRALGGSRLFRYRADGDLVALRASQVNEYLRIVTDRHVTAKDFRTWTGTLCVLQSFCKASKNPSEEEAHEVVLEALDQAAERLGNTRATTRDFYVHPGLVEAYEAGRLAELIESVEEERRSLRRPGHREGESLLLALLPRLERFLPSD